MKRRRKPRQFSDIELLEVRMIFDQHEPELPPSLWEEKPVVIPFKLIALETVIEGDAEYWPPTFSPADPTAIEWWLFQPPLLVSGTVTAQCGRWIPRNKAAFEFLRWRRAHGYSGGASNFLLGGRRVD